MADFEKLAEAIKNNDEREISRFIKEVLPRISAYLQTVCSAPKYQADEAANHVLSQVYERILEKKLQINRDLFNYMLVSSRNEYIRMVKREMRQEDIYQQDDNVITSPAEQIENMLDQERENHLRQCLNKLDDGSRSLITYIMNNPDEHLKVVAEKFQFTYGTIRVKKGAIVKTLQDCVQQKLQR